MSQPRQIRYLFFFVHPAKYHLFRETINALLKSGSTVDVVIVTKDVLEELVQHEGWSYTNIFPEGRRMRGLPIVVGTAINFVRTLWRLHRYVRNRSYDVFVTDDCLSILGRFHRIPTYFFMDNDIETVPEASLLLRAAHWVLAPRGVKLGRAQHKALYFDGYKELAYLHPNYFQPDSQAVTRLAGSGPFVIIRTVSMTASHDRGIHGLSDAQVRKLCQLIAPVAQVFISSERVLPADLNRLRLRVKPWEISDVMSSALLFIGDSGTMASEAAVLGVPSIFYHAFVGRLQVMEEKETHYGLMFNFHTTQFDALLSKVEQLLSIPDLKAQWRIRADRMLSEKEDVTKFILDCLQSKGQALDAAA